jgi:hypothetical protein
MASPIFSPRRSRDKRELKRPDDLAVTFDDQQKLVHVRIDRAKRVQIFRRALRPHRFPGRAQDVIRKQGNDGGHVFFGGPAEN